MCTGPLKKICHWGPLTALGIIKLVSFTTIHLSGQWWPPQESISGLFNSVVFLALCALTIYHFLSALYHGPGFLPVCWDPPDGKHRNLMQYCNPCSGFKAPRAHHCKKCNRCVLKMDHHCPWINGCVGHSNHTSFTLFLFFAVCGCAQATVVIAISLYYALYRNWYRYHGTGQEPVIIMNVYMFGVCIFALGLAIGVVIAVGMLLICQLRSIVQNRTSIEQWIISKAEYRRKEAASRGITLKPFIYPYNIDWWTNTKQIFNLSLTPVGDGITWPVAEGCDQYTLTREQIAQKSEKRDRSRPYLAVTRYSGSILPVSHGLRVCCSPPCSDESRLALWPGDRVVVTRFLKHWFFGEKIHGKGCMFWTGAGVGPKGWFPRCCVTPVLVVDGQEAPVPPADTDTTDTTDITDADSKKND